MSAPAMKGKDGAAKPQAAVAATAAAISPGQKKPTSGDGVNASLAALREKMAVHGAGDPGQSQKERWFQTMKLNQVLPPFPASGHAANRTGAFDNNDSSVKCQSTGGAAGGFITSPRSRSSGTTSDFSAPSVPPHRGTLHPSGTAAAAAACQLQSKMSAKGSSSKAAPPPGVPRPGVSVPKAHPKAQAARIQAKPLNVDITTGLKIVSSAHLDPSKTGRSGPANAASQAGIQKSALVTNKRAKSVDKTRVTAASEEERTAKRREQWRIKKREQRAKLAKSRERTQCAETMLQRPITPKTGLFNRGGLKYLPGLSSVRSMGQKQSVHSPKALDAPAGRLLKDAQVMVGPSFMHRNVGTTMKKEEIKIEQSGPAALDTDEHNQNQNPVFVKVENPQVARKTQADFGPNVTVEKRMDHTRKFSNYMYFSNVSRGIARCRTPRQRFIETQKCFSNQRNVRVKFPTLATIYNSRNVPKINPNESPEQTASRRREYWRIKKREQRAKQSLEVKNRLKEKDSLMRRVKRYQKILEEMRKARAQTQALEATQPTCSMLTHASETIGGFIKEDGTVTSNIPQVPMDTAAAAAAGRGAEQTSCLLSNNDIIVHSQSQPRLESLGHHRSVALGDLGRLSQRPPPPLRPAQVRVSLPRDGQSANKPPRLLSIRPRTQFQMAGAAAAANSNRLVVHNPSQITLTHPPFPVDAGSDVSAPGAGGCVMKMEVSSLLAAPYEDPELTEEQRMAKKREYWRVKKREQRASRAAKLKQGLLLARGNAAMQRRKTHKQTPVQRAAMTNATQSGNVAKQKVNILPSPNVNVPNPQQAKQIKQEGAPAADLNIPPEQTICPIKLPPLPLTLALPQPEPDPTLTAETQATTLLAVASMKKLLEESLSTVSECQPNIKTEQPPCKAEMGDYVSEEHLEQEMKSNIPMISLGEEDKLPLAANLTLQIKSWQADPDDLVHSCSQDPYLEASSQTGKSPPPRSSTTQDLQCTSAESAGCPTPMSPLRRAKRLCTKKSGNQHQQNCCSQAPPKLHHSPSAAHPPSQQQPQPHKVQPAPQPPRCLPQSQPSSLQQYRRSSLAESVVVKGSMNSLQKKREYWKLMKRQQRARSKARQKGSLSHRQNSRILSPNTVQTLNQLSTNSSQSGKSQSPLNKRALQPKAPTASLTAVHSIPTLLVVSPTESTVGQSPDIIQVKPPVCSFTSSPSRGQHEVNARPAGTSCDPDISACSRTPGGKVDVLMSDGASDSKRRLMESQLEVMQGSFVDGSRVRKWTMQENINAAPAFATLTPPDNPLSSINLSPIEPLAPTPGCNSSHSSPIKPFFAQSPKPKTANASSPTKLLPISTLAPPKPIPGESQEEFLRRKREYWRVKKKEQRARKAIRDRELSQRRAPGNWKPIRPAKDQNQPQCTEKQDPGYWGAACEESEHLMSSTSDAEMGYYSYSSYTVPMEDEDPDGCFTDSGVLFADGDHGEEDGSISDGAWRNRYLMDHDPLNQLLVCMVCGDLLYSHSLEGVRAHIEEAHPETLNLEPPECRRILDAWDEQVSQRERFFTSQLQQHGGATLAEANGT